LNLLLAISFLWDILALREPPRSYIVTRIPGLQRRSLRACQRITWRGGGLEGALRPIQTTPLIQCTAITQEVTAVLRKVKGPDRVGRDAMYYPDRQEQAYKGGAYDYLHSVAMLPRMAILGAYVRAFGLTSVLDVGCGTGALLDYLDPTIGYIGVDIAAAAIDAARSRFAQRPNASFHVANFRDWTLDDGQVDAVVWSGIGCTWTRKGRGGNLQDWIDILDLAERPLRPGGYLLFELVTVHWPTLERLIADRYTYETGCDLDCFQSEESPKRSIRVFRKKASGPAVTLAHPAPTF
jgi:SAM-dependent methyltransferase